MNLFAEKKEDFIKYGGDVKKLFRELYNVCKLFSDSCFYYCYCDREKSIKCGLCQFDELFYDKSFEKYLLTHRNDEKKLLKVVDNYFIFICKIQKEDPNALNFLDKEYVWSFTDYNSGVKIQQDIDELIENNEDLIERNGLKNFIKAFVNGK